MGVLDELLLIACVQFAITLLAVAVDLGLVFRIVWWQFLRKIPKEDRPYLWASIANAAKASREEAERLARLKEAYARR